MSVYPSVPLYRHAWERRSTLCSEEARLRQAEDAGEACDIKNNFWTRSYLFKFENCSQKIEKVSLSKIRFLDRHDCLASLSISEWLCLYEQTQFPL